MSETRSAGQARTGAEAFEIKVGLAEMLKGGVIMDVTTPEQAKISEDAGATAVMALERVPADIRKEGGVARMCSIEVIEGIQKSVSIPVMAKVRIGHFQEARVLEAGTRARASRRPMKPTTSGSTTSVLPSSAAHETSARRCGASARAPP